MNACGESLIITKMNNSTLEYSYSDLLEILKDIHSHTNVGQEIPLANAVNRVSDEGYNYGLGRAFYKITKNVTLAQGASYIAPILDQANIFDWNGRTWGAHYSLRKLPKSESDIRDAICTEIVRPNLPITEE